MKEFIISKSGVADSKNNKRKALHYFVLMFKWYDGRKNVNGIFY